MIGKAVVTEDDDWTSRVAGKWAIVRRDSAPKQTLTFDAVTSYYVELIFDMRRPLMRTRSTHFDEVAEAFAKLHLNVDRDVGVDLEKSCA